MFPLFFFTIRAKGTYNVTFDDIAIGVWSGYEVMESRMATACETWVRQFPQVAIFSDRFPDGSQNLLQRLAMNTKLSFFELGDCSQVKYPSAWERAQPRFLKAMETLYNHNKSKKWFFFVDDDSFPIAYNLLDLLTEYDYQKSTVIGHFYCSWFDVVWANEPQNKDICVSFAQGGAGVVISSSYFARIINFLDECNVKYNHREYAGSMRFAKCSWDHFKNEWEMGRILQMRNDKFFSSNILAEMNAGNVHERPVNFHKMHQIDLIEGYFAVRSEWFAADNKTLFFVDWSHLFGKPFEITIPSSDESIYYKFGYSLSEEKESGLISIIRTNIIPIFKENDPVKDNPIGYYQNFSYNKVRITMMCDDDLDDSSFEQDYVENHHGLDIYGYFKCPKPSHYPWAKK